MEIYVFGIRILLEDFLFGFSGPVLGAFLYFLIFNKNLDKQITDIRSFIFKFVSLAGIFLLLFAFFNIVGKINSIFACSISAVILTLYILLKRSDLIKSYAITAVISAFTAFIFYYLFQLAIGNEYLFSVWLLDHATYGFKFFNVVIPLTEIQFAFFIPPFLMSLILYCAQLREKK